MFLWKSVFNYPCFYGYPFGYPWISMDIHALTCYGFSIQGAHKKGKEKKKKKERTPYISAPNFI